MTDQTDITTEVAQVRGVTEFEVTYFDLADLEADALLDLYADHAYKFAERHGLPHPLITSRSHPSVEAWEASPAEAEGGCLDCGRHYGDLYGFPDLNVSDEVWAILCPERAPGGLLCPSCMCARAYRKGIRAVAYFASGPFEETAP